MIDDKRARKCDSASERASISFPPTHALHSRLALHFVTISEATINDAREERSLHCRGGKKPTILAYFSKV